MRTYKDAKAMAKSLRGALAARGVSLSHSACLEIVAKQFGCADWNTLAATLDVEPSHLARPADSERVAQPAENDGSCRLPETIDAEHPVSCSFCGKSQHDVRSLVEGACGSRGTSPCVFICDECVAFCAEINAGAARDGTSARDLKNS